MTDSSAVAVEGDDAIVTVTVGSGARHNAMRTEDWAELAEFFESLAHRDRLRCVVLRGSGDSFSAGSDIHEWQGASLDQVDESFAQMERAFVSIERLPVPVVGAVAGAATGAGCQLALACDVRVVASDSRIGMPVIRLGVLVSEAFADRLSREVGPGLTRDLLYTGRLLSGVEAYRCGLAQRCVDPGLVDPSARDVAVRVAELPQTAVRAAKKITSPGAHPRGRHSVDHRALALGVSRFLGRKGPAAQRSETSGAA